jgi:hypothetical protein
MKPFEYIKNYYNVPADIGRRVTVYGDAGIIVEDRGHYLGVNFDKHKATDVRSVHPTDEVVYGEMGKRRKLTASQKRYAEFCNSEFGGTFAEWLGIKPKEPLWSGSSTWKYRDIATALEGYRK